MNIACLCILSGNKEEKIWCIFMEVLVLNLYINHIRKHFAKYAKKSNDNTITFFLNAARNVEVPPKLADIFW